MSCSTPTIPYDSKQYWHERFQREDFFEWLLSWKDVSPYVKPYLAEEQQSTILHLGCGNSQLAFDMADDGYDSVNVDYAPVVIDKMAQVTAAKQDASRYNNMIRWVAADCLDDLSPVGGPYKRVLDKGLVDTICCGADDVSKEQQLFQQVASVTRPGIVWISISFSSERQACAPWALEKKIPILAPQPNDKPGAPEIYYFIYVFRRSLDD